MDERSFPIPIYLNQRVVFDLLAIAQGGFSQLQSVKTSDADENKRKTSGSGEIGTSNAFAFLRIGVKATHERDATSTFHRETAEDRVFTPTSLFSQLRSTLLEKKLLKHISVTVPESQITSGNFVEFKATLQRNPLSAALDSVLMMIDISKALDVPQSTGTRGQSQKPNQQVELIKVTSQLKKFKEYIQQPHTYDLIANITGSQSVAVLPVEDEYFSEMNPLGIAEGEYTVLGKVMVMASTETGNTLSLLRGTTLALFPEGALKTLQDAFNGLGRLGFHLPDVVFEIKQPAILIMPIAISI